MLLLLASLLLPSAHAAEVRLLFNAPDTEDRPGDRCTQEVCTSLLELIDGAERSIDFAIYGIRDQTAIFEALVAARDRGVAVRGVVDRDVNDHSYYSSTDALMEALGTVQTDYRADLSRVFDESKRQAESYRCDRPMGFAGPVQCVELDLGERCLFASHASREPLGFQGDIMHDKFFVVDGRWLWTGSTNVSNSGTGGYNANTVVLLDSRKVARWYTQEFEQMYEEGRYHRLKKAHGPRRARFGSDLAVDLYFSPQEKAMEHGVRPLVQGARERIDVAIFFLTHPGVAQDLIDAHLRGVEVRVIIDATAAKNGYTKHELLRAAGIPVKVESWGGKMHAKTAIIDGEAVIAGSMNWTSAGTRANDENTLIVFNAHEAARGHAWFDAMWRSIDDQWLSARPDPESRSSARSCFDGVDNDFDGQADQEDRGCRRDPPDLPPLPPYRVVPKADGYGLIKAAELKDQGKVYDRPGGPGYLWMRADLWFCTERQAREAGYLPYLR